MALTDYEKFWDEISQVEEVDYDDEMIKAAKEEAADLPNIRFVKQDAACLDLFEDNVLYV